MWEITWSLSIKTILDKLDEMFLSSLLCSFFVLFVCKQWSTLLITFQVSKQLYGGCRTWSCVAVLVWIVLGDQLQRKMGWTGEMALQSVTLTLKLSFKMPYLFPRLMKKASLLLPSWQTFLSNGSSCIQQFLFEVRFYFSVGALNYQSERETDICFSSPVFKKPGIYQFGQLTWMNALQRELKVTAIQTRMSKVLN